MYLRRVKGSSLRVKRWLVPTCFWQYSHPEQRACDVFSKTSDCTSVSYRGSLADWPKDLEECSEIFLCQEYPPGLTPKTSLLPSLLPGPGPGKEKRLVSSSLALLPVRGSRSCLSLSLMMMRFSFLRTHVIKSAHILIKDVFKGVLIWCWGIGYTVNNDDNKSADLSAGGRRAGADTTS